MRYFFGIVLCGGLLACVATPASADTTGGGITITPAFQDITLDQAGQEVDFFATITNDTSVPVTLRLSVLDFGSLDESGGVAFLGASSDLERKYSLASWIRPEKDVVTILPGETQKVTITIENRDSLGPGGHYGALAFKTEDVIRNDASNSIAVNQLFSSLVFVKKIGGEIYGLDLKGREVSHNPIRLPDSIRLRFQNTGNVHVVPRGIVTIADPLGRIVRKGIINAESGIILPETLRIYPVMLKSVEQSLIPGNYTLSIAYRYDGQEAFETISAELGLFIPVPMVAVSVGVLVALGWYIVRRRKKKQQS